jgi:hypothetical protein
MKHWLGALTVARFVPARQLFIPIATGPAVADRPDAPRLPSGMAAQPGTAVD